MRLIAPNARATITVLIGLVVLGSVALVLLATTDSGYS